MGGQGLLLQLSSTAKVVAPPLAVRQLGSCSNFSSRRACWPRAARHSQGGPRPLGPQPRPQLLERAASKVADSTSKVADSTAFLSSRLTAAFHALTAVSTLMSDMHTNAQLSHDAEAEAK